MTAAARLEALLHRPLAALPTPAVGVAARALARLAVPRLTPGLAAAVARTVAALRPDLDIAAAVAEARDNLARTFCELPRLGRLWDEGRIAIAGTLPTDRPVLIAWVHTGNPEILPLALGRSGARPIGIAAPQPTALRARIVATQRAAAGAVVLPGQGAAALRAALRVLERRAGALVIAIDDVAADGTINGPSLGRTAPAAGNLPLVARLAARTGAAIVPAWVERHRGARFTLHLAPAVECGDALDRALSAAVLRLLPQWWFCGRWRMTGDHGD